MIDRLIDDIREWHAEEPDWRETRERIAARLRLRQVRRQLPHGAQPRADHPRPAVRRGRLPEVADDRQHLRAGTPTATPATSAACWASRTAWPAIDTGRTGAARRRPAVPAHRRRRARHHRRRDRDLQRRQYRPGAGRRRAPLAPKGGARFHFELPGSVQGFQPDESVETRGTARLENVAGPQRSAARAAWRCATDDLAPGRIGSRRHADLRAARSHRHGRLHAAGLAHALPGPDCAGAGRRPTPTMPRRSACRLYLSQLRRRRQARAHLRARSRRSAPAAAHEFGVAHPRHGRRAHRRDRGRASAGQRGRAAASTWTT